ncbi:hypothetical protein JX265_003496 [Neoarthrinium moseri]|uniref:Uncharacterized protein n=1 Tax=Neoarthrinium moseri TaxID=1658444 RepID=A0A9P9WSC5_9PEZI|nr:hypothetical protein JX265_003496 [Neoarthrinium moseri]
MSTAPSFPQHAGRSPQLPRQQPGTRSSASRPPLRASPVVPSKRSDDDIQFISSNPVKRQKITEAKYHTKVTPPPALSNNQAQSPQTPPHQQTDSQLQQAIGEIDSHSILPVTGGCQDAGQDTVNTHGRRVSTGMVGLPSDFHDVGAGFGNRGVSLPFLENFVLNQPPRKYRPMSSPPLSPKQLPPTSSQFTLNNNVANREGIVGNYGIYSQANTSFSEEHSSNWPGFCSAPTSTPRQNSPTATNSPLTPTSTTSAVHPMNVDRTMSSMPPPSAPTSHQCEKPSDNLRQTPPAVQQSTLPPADASQASAAKQPCQLCVQMAQRATLARQQGTTMPMMSQRLLSTQAMPPMPSSPIPPYPHLHSQFMTMGPHNMQGYSHGYPHVMMPMNLGGFGGMLQLGGMTTAQQTTAHQHLSTTATPPPTPTKAGDANQAMPSTPTPGSNTCPGSFKPPATLIQPTYRKPSPNLIVDVAETCQEKFPFEEVARRHNTPVDKVIDVFAAIIQVPLLRSPTDRRRPGKLATSRVREYTRAKRDIQDERGAGGSKDEIVVRPLEIAQRLGPTEPLEDFSLPG